MDDAIREAIRAAEEAAADVPFAFRVVKAAPPPVDLDRRNWEGMRLKLAGERRERLDRDFRVWESTRELLGALREALAAESNGVGDSPVFTRLLRVHVRPPRLWSICRKCEGKGDGDLGYCRNCQGHGWRT